MLVSSIHEVGAFELCPSFPSWYLCMRSSTCGVPTQLRLAPLLCRDSWHLRVPSNGGLPPACTKPCSCTAVCSLARQPGQPPPKQLRLAAMLAFLVSDCPLVSLCSSCDAH